MELSQYEQAAQILSETLKKMKPGAHGSPYNYVITLPPPGGGW